MRGQSRDLKGLAMMLTIEPARGSRRRLQVTPVFEGVYRIAFHGDTVGYVVQTGSVFVTLEGRVYNTSVEIEQSLDLEHAAAALVRT